MNVADVLRGAADLIEPVGGWFQLDEYGQRRVDGSHCVVTAIGKVAAVAELSGRIGRGRVPDLYAAAWDALSEFVGAQPNRWNDDPATTQELVAKTLRAIADRQDAAP